MLCSISYIAQMFEKTGWFIIVYFVNSFKPEFKIVIFIHYKARIAVAILGL